MKKLTQKDIATMMKLRGLGFHQTEIAKELMVTPGAISYQLIKIKKQAKAHGIDKTFKVYCAWLEETK